MADYIYCEAIPAGYRFLTEATMNADAMGKVLGPVADDVTMLLSGVDGVLYDLRDFPTLGAGAGIGIAFVHEPECRLP